MARKPDGSPPRAQPGGDGEITETMERFPLGVPEDVFDETSESGPLVRPFTAHEGPLVPTLRVIAGPDLMGFAALRPDDQIVLGRTVDEEEAEPGSLGLSDRTVSRRHARITADGT